MGKVITITWNSEEYTLNENEAFLAADAVEDVITVGELVEMLQSMRNVRFAKLAMAFGALLREAGASVSDKEIHDEFKAALSNAPQAEKMALARKAMLNLVGVIMDGAPSEGGDSETKNVTTPAL